jgi:hypothetical protein
MGFVFDDQNLYGVFHGAFEQLLFSIVLPCKTPLLLRPMIAGACFINLQSQFLIQKFWGLDHGRAPEYLIFKKSESVGLFQRNANER